MCQYHCVHTFYAATQTHSHTGKWKMTCYIASRMKWKENSARPGAGGRLREVSELLALHQHSVHCEICYLTLSNRINMIGGGTACGQHVMTAPNAIQFLCRPRYVRCICGKRCRNDNLTCFMFIEYCLCSCFEFAENKRLNWNYICICVCIVCIVLLFAERMVRLQGIGPT